jgi:hypothetical protein
MSDSSILASNFVSGRDADAPNAKEMLNDGGISSIICVSVWYYHK